MTRWQFLPSALTCSSHLMGPVFDKSPVNTVRWSTADSNIILVHICNIHIICIQNITSSVWLQHILVLEVLHWLTMQLMHSSFWRRDKGDCRVHAVNCMMRSSNNFSLHSNVSTEKLQETKNIKTIKSLLVHNQPTHPFATSSSNTIAISGFCWSWRCPYRDRILPTCHLYRSRFHHL